MTASRKIKVALAGLSFGAEFLPIFQHHPNVDSLTICDSDPEVLQKMGDRFGVKKRVLDLDDVLADDSIDAVHLVTPIPVHAEQTVAVLNAGKHCACTVPMATSIEDLNAIVAAQRASGKVYMGMETAVYTRRFLHVKEMIKNGEIGRIQFLRGAHYQDMEFWPPYWMGLPPMHYATHAVSPVLALAQTQAKAVHCFGSGVMRPELHEQYGNPFPIETAIYELNSDPPLAAEITRSLFHTARGLTESFNVYGEKATFEWEQIEEEPPVVFRMKPVVTHWGRGNDITAERLDVPDRQDLLPKEIARFTQRGVYDETHTHLSFLQGGGHGGSHPHLVHEFVSSIVEGRQPFPDALTTAAWTAAGVCAHESAMNGGARIVIPQFN
ncbi:MAG: Gfo/Idh/MocA family oxidoreductase [Chloroflexi bacterium]|nr:Gfo/Idh/MocA family oxidoreductase [Chloroflexota bacterium]